MTDLYKLAGKPEWYPEMDALIDLCAHDLSTAYTRAEALRMVRDVFAGLTQADLQGMISTGDEHEWARIACRANERAVSE